MRHTALTLSILASLGLSLPVQAGSLWTKESNNERGMFSDKRAKNIGDIVTVIVQENVTSSQVQEVKTSRENNPAPGIVTDLLNQFIAGIPAAINRQVDKGRIPKPPQILSDMKFPTLNPKGTDEYGAKGEVTGRQSIVSRAAVTVVDVLPNGNLVVEGSKVVGTGKERQYAYLRGIVRAYDVTKDNTVLSSNLADVQLEFIPEGTLTDTKKGWLQRLNDRLRQF